MMHGTMKTKFINAKQAKNVYDDDNDDNNNNNNNNNNKRAY